MGHVNAKRLKVVLHGFYKWLLGAGEAQYWHRLAKLAYSQPANYKPHTFVGHTVWTSTILWAPLWRHSVFSHLHGSLASQPLHRLHVSTRCLEKLNTLMAYLLLIASIKNSAISASTHLARTNFSDLAAHECSKLRRMMYCVRAYRSTHACALTNLILAISLLIV